MLSSECNSVLGYQVLYSPNVHVLTTLSLTHRLTRSKKNFLLRQYRESKGRIYILKYPTVNGVI